VSVSNSLIEAWWRSLKHRWLFLHPLDNLATVRRLVEFYVIEHNERIPHGAFQGSAPTAQATAPSARHRPGVLGRGIPKDCAKVVGMRSTNPIVLVAFLAATTAACNNAHSGSGSSVQSIELKTLTVDEVASHLNDPTTFIFDNNSKDRYDKGHIPGSKWIRPDEITAATLPADKSATLVFYCANEHCNACHSGAKAALALGYVHVFIMPAGIAGWEKARKPVVVAAA
jgi:rhodanese-related sulfurtransferase/predicted small secreted protein